MNELHSEGNILYNGKEYELAIEKWLVSLEKYKNDKNDEMMKKIYSNLAQVFIKLKNYYKVIDYCKMGRNVGKDRNIEDKLIVKNEIANSELKLINNSKIKLSEKKSSCIGIYELKLFNNNYINVPINSYYTSDKTKRFIGVLNVLTCISVFVISKDKIFVCHLPASNLIHINNTKKIFKKELKDGNWDKVILIGGHRAADLYANRIKFANAIKSILESILPGIEIDCSKLNIYKGKHIKKMEDEIELRERNTRFVLAIYDSFHNIIITHTDYKTENVVNHYLENVFRNEEKYYKEIDFINGQDIKNEYYEF